jgi:hypothetical protein
VICQVSIEPWVVADLGALPLSRASKIKLLVDVNTRLPAEYCCVRGARCTNNPACFWYQRVAVEGHKFYMVRFAVDDSVREALRVVWLDHVA